MTTLSHHSTLGVLDSLLQSSNDQQFAFQDTSATSNKKNSKQKSKQTADTTELQQAAPTTTALSCKNYPLTLMPLATQIAGHGSEGDGQRAILKREDGRLLKPIQKPPKGKDLFDCSHNSSHSTLYPGILKIKTIIVEKQNFVKMLFAYHF